MDSMKSMNVSSMCEDDGPCEDSAGPREGSRESAISILTSIVHRKRAELTGLEQLLKITEKAEAGSPLEAVLYSMVRRYH